MSLPNPIRRKKAEYSFRPHSFLVMKDDEPWAIVRPLRRHSDPIEDPSGYTVYLVDESDSYQVRTGTPEDALRGLIRKVG